MANDGPTWSAWEECRKHWRAYLLVSAASILLAAIVSVSIPREYAAQVKIADEHKETDLLLGLNNVAAWAKTALNGHEGLRMPEAYYQLVMTRDFAEEMSKVTVEGYGTDYYHYILAHYEQPWWSRWISHWGKPEDEHERVIRVINERIRSKVSIRYGTTLLQVTDNDPVVAAMMVDSVKAHLQLHMARHARQTALYDLELTQIETLQAENRFKTARDEYVRYTDSHNDPLQGYPSATEDHLQKEYEAAFTTLEKKKEQLLRAQAFVDKFSFTFAVVTNATVPQTPSGPVTFGYMLSFVFIGLTLTTWVVLGRKKYQLYKNR